MLRKYALELETKGMSVKDIADELERKMRFDFRALVIAMADENEDGTINGEKLLEALRN
jgi:Fe-S-cluster formation regulator IscX/YfhJ